VSSKPTYSIVIFLHGRKNCVINVGLQGPRNKGCGTGSRSAYSLISSFDASKANALLVIPELKFDASTGNPGVFADKGNFALFLTELFSASALGSVLPVRTLDQIDNISVMSHSAGYWATAMILRHGGVNNIRQVVLFDSLYNYADDFIAWIQQSLKSPNCRFQFANIYSRNGDTYADSQKMATRASSIVPAAQFLDDRKPSAALAPGTTAYNVFFKYSSLDHDSIPRVYFPNMVAEFIAFPACSREGAGLVEDADESSMSVASSSASSSEIGL
jgi:hypothetical protein